MIKCKKNPDVNTWFCLFVVFARSVLDGLLYMIVKLIWKLIQSRIVPNLVLVDIFLVTGTIVLSAFTCFQLFHA